jgi:hypothetical protein
MNVNRIWLWIKPMWSKYKRPFGTIAAAQWLWRLRSGLSLPQDELFPQVFIPGLLSQLAFIVDMNWREGDFKAWGFFLFFACEIVWSMHNVRGIFFSPSLRNFEWVIDRFTPLEKLAYFAVTEMKTQSHRHWCNCEGGTYHCQPRGFLKIQWEICVLRFKHMSCVCHGAVIRW